MLPRPSRLKSVASEFSPVLTTPPPVEPNTVLVLMSVPPMMLSSNLTVRRLRAAISAATPASAANAPPPMTQPGVLPTRSSNHDPSFFGRLRLGGGRLRGCCRLRRLRGSGLGRLGEPALGRLRPAFGGSGAFVSGAGALRPSAAPPSRPPAPCPACASTCAPPGCPLSSSAFCRSFSVFSSSLMRVCASFSALSRDTTSSAAVCLARPCPPAATP